MWIYPSDIGFAKFLCPRKGKPAEALYLKKDGSNPGFTNPILGSKGASEAGESGDGRCELLLSVSAFTVWIFTLWQSYAIFHRGNVMINIDKPSIFGGSLFSKKPNEFDPAKWWFGTGGTQRPSIHGAGRQGWRVPHRARTCGPVELRWVECAVSIMFLWFWCRWSHQKGGSNMIDLTIFNHI